VADRQPVRAQWSNEAHRLWKVFYIDWESRERSGLFSAALKRIHLYVCKLAMSYAAVGTHYQTLHSHNCGQLLLPRPAI
jgi:hypothetical protein